ncbi:MAG: hydrogenase expression/formation protein HypE [Planctomycetales bacterium]|nr:hydrogenase expression/formation protein HypE [Planctomycetales bacterium]
MADDDRRTEFVLPYSSACPAAVDQSNCIQLAHGEGGRLMRQLLKERIAPTLQAAINEDAARISAMKGDWAVTTDSFVVSPLFFPGGNIGSLAVYGTVNDLSVAGADPIAITLSLIIEEGLSFQLLDEVLSSVARTANECGVRVVAGDTKVVPRGAVDKLFITTTGVGQYRPASHLQCQQIQSGDLLLISGPIGQHGMAVLAAREKLHMTPEPISDCGNLRIVCATLHNQLGEDLRAMRDATRGGVSAVLQEWSEASGTTMQLYENQLPVTAETRGMCELLGLDPLYVANEGTFVAAVAPSVFEKALEVMREFSISSRACAIGKVIDKISSPVVIERMLGTLHPIDDPAGAPLPRIC